MDVLPFSYNWNNKLDCKAFTTIRLYNPSKHIAGNKMQVVLKGEQKGIATITDVKPFLLENVNPFIAYLDTGYSVDECKKIILRMYPKIDFKTKKLALLLIVKDNK